ncbi:MAG: N-acetylmannosamine-6-phosphate 2-epimerase [Atopobiaceae bacterium]|jgi:N-acylglucosamine-6-phosphate 2-epimerase|nr:N-acetylmannosamine-6-phosphate 2-epimerase [Atopobiaceae bacterium]
MDDVCEVISSMRGGLVVSCQAYPGEPLRHPETMAQMALACQQGGAVAIRCQGIADIAAIRGAVEVPVVGLAKEGHEGVYITPTLRHALACVMAGADVVALDASDRPRPDGRTFEQTVSELRERVDTLVMADCRTIADVRRGFAAGCDLCSTTLSHGTAATDCAMADGPDLELLRQAVAEFPGRPVVCEGRVHSPADARAAIEAGAWCVVVGTAITHPTSITSWFREAVEDVGGRPR